VQEVARELDEGEEPYHSEGEVGERQLERLAPRALLPFALALLGEALALRMGLEASVHTVISTEWA
jgi:hypothetical protein